MRIRTKHLVICAAILSVVSFLLHAGDMVTTENAFDPGPNSADEPFIEKFSFPAAVRYIDTTVLTWQKQKKCFSCHADYPFLLARPMVSHKASAHVTIR